MSGCRLAGLAVLTVSLGLAQQPAPHIGYVYPAGGQRGTTVTITIGGQFLRGAGELLFSDPSLEARVTGYSRPMTFAEFRKLREEIEPIAEKLKAAGVQDRAARLSPEANALLTPEERRRLAELRRQMATSVLRPVTPAISEQVTAEVTIPANAPPGDIELRLSAAGGLTNPVRFSIGQWPEVSGPPAEVPDERRAGNKLLFSSQREPRKPPEPAAVTLPATLNGQIEPGGVDRYRFHADAGQKIVVAVRARELIPYISDAVPGWFEAAISVFDPAGKEIRHADHFHFQADPVLCHEVRESGQHVLEVRDSLYRGREDFVYRVTIGEIPYVTGVFPLGGQEGERPQARLSGWNVSSPEVVLLPAAPGGSSRMVAAWGGERLSNAAPFAVGTLPERMENEPNDTAERAERVVLPGVVNGKISRPGERDVFALEGEAGMKIVAEILARRLGSPLDSRLTLFDSNGRRITANDDHKDKGAALLTHHADSLLTATLPASGLYYIEVADTQGRGGDGHAYRLRLSRPRPDFELRVTPASVNLRAGMTLPVTVHALRRDGFDGQIVVQLKNAPAGLTLSGGRIPPGQTSVRMTLTAPVGLDGSVVRPGLEGRARIGGRMITRDAVPAEDMMQAFAYRHLVPAKEWVVKVLPGGRRKMNWTLASTGPIRLSAGSRATPVRFAMPLGRMAERLRFELSDPPEGLTLADVEAGPRGVSMLLQAGPEAGEASVEGNLIVDLYLKRPPNPEKKGPGGKDVHLGTLPAIPFEIAGRPGGRE